MPSCCGDGQFCDFPWCDCTGNAEFREAHKLVNPSDKEQDCGKSSCNYCDQTVRRERTSGVKAPDHQAIPPAGTDGTQGKTASVLEAEQQQLIRLLDAALHHARASHAVRGRTDSENVAPVHDEAALARKAVIEYVIGSSASPASEAGGHAAAPSDKREARLRELVGKLDGYLNSPEQIALQDELHAALFTPGPTSQPRQSVAWGGREFTQILAERDTYHEWADRLANAIAEHFGIDIGEHSNVNNPWREALEAFPAEPEATPSPTGEGLQPIHPNHLPDLRYALDALRLAGEAIEPLTEAQIKLHRIKRDMPERIDAAIVGMRYVIKRTEEAASLSHQSSPQTNRVHRAERGENAPRDGGSANG